MQERLNLIHHGVIWTYLLIILRCTIFRIMILSAQSLRKSDIFCFNAGFISCFAMTLRWSHDALHLRSIWARLSWSWSKSTWQQYHRQKDTDTDTVEKLFNGFFKKVNKANLGQAGDSAYLRVEVCAVWKLLDHDGAGVVQQGLLVNRVLHLRDFFQVTQLKAFSLEMHAYTATAVTMWDGNNCLKLKIKSP